MTKTGFRKLICLLTVFMLAARLCVLFCGAEETSDEYERLESSDTADTGKPAESPKEMHSGTDSLEELGMLKSEGSVDEILAEMTLREKVGQMIIATFRGWPEDHGPASYSFTRMNSRIREAISRDRFGGVLLYAENCENTQDTIRLVNDMQTANQDTDSKNVIPLFVAIDQEGGIVNRLGQGTQWPGNMAVTASGDIENARETGKKIAEELSLLSINTDFGVVLDVNDNPDNPIIGVRAFSDDTKTVADYGKAFYEGMSENGTIAVLKHFPGHGNTSVDSHTGLPRVEKTLEELNHMELVPFRTGIEAGAEMIMTAHIQYPEIEKETYVSKSTGEKVEIPATLSKTILTDILRGKMNFDGVIVADALEMVSLTEHFREEDVYRMAINAGVDLLLAPRTVYNSDTLDKLEECIDNIVEMVENGQISQERIDESVRRILTLKARHGLLDEKIEPVTDKQVEEAAAGLWSEENRAEEWEMMKKGLTLLKNEGEAIPFSLKEEDRVLVFYPGQSRVNTAEYARQRLEAEKIIPEGTDWETIVYEPDNAQQCLQAVREADHVIAVTTMFEVTEMVPDSEDGESGRVLDQIIEEVHKENKKITVISAELPYDAARYQEADALIVTYGSARMMENAESGKSVSPNLPAAICAVFGEFTPEGTLPVNIPALNEEYKFSKDILYPRGFSAVKARDDKKQEEKSEDKTKPEEKEEKTEEQLKAKEQQEVKSEEKAEEKAEEKTEKKAEDKAEEKAEEKTEEKAEDKAEEKE